jgi:lipase ATG15
MMDYPGVTVYLTGHSLGGALSGLVANKLGLTAVTFESPGTSLFNKKVSLGLERGYPKVFNYGFDSDPIFMGECNGFLSMCHYAGYIMNAKCHLGMVCKMTDSLLFHMQQVEANGSLLHHRIKYLLEYLRYNELPECGIQVGCSECTDFKYQ